MSGRGGFVGKQAAAVCLPSVEGQPANIDYSFFVLLVTGSSTIASVAMASLASFSSSPPLSLGQGIVYSLYRPR